ESLKKFVENYNNYYEDTIIKTYKEGRNNYFYYENPNLDLMEAKAIIDLVYSSHFFTLKTKENYKKRMQDLFSIHNQAYFQKRLNLHVVKNENEQVFYQELEVITKAIKEKKKIRFEYQKPSLTFNEKHKLTELAPIDTVFSNNEYYLLCQGAKDPNTCIQYRLDYVKNVEIVKDSDVKFDDYQLNSFEKKLNNMTYMYGEGKIEVIELEFTPNVYSNMIDKFGKNIHPKKINENLYCVQVRHIINSIFYSWIIGFGGRIQIADNDVHKKQFKDFLMENFINKNNAD
ncbi:WYL domain-containing protein, partial [Coprobacillus sp. OF03-2AA]